MTELEDPIAPERTPTIRDGIRAGLPLALPALLVAISFGVLARSLGWGTAAPIVCSAVVFAGSAQFAAASVLGAGGAALTAVLSAVLVNARFLAMGFAIGPSLKAGRCAGRPRARPSWTPHGRSPAAATARSRARCSSGRRSRSTWAGGPGRSSASSSAT